MLKAETIEYAHPPISLPPVPVLLVRQLVNTAPLRKWGEGGEGGEVKLDPDQMWYVVLSMTLHLDEAGQSRGTVGPSGPARFVDSGNAPVNHFPIYW